MKLKFKEFEILARCKGYESGYQLLKELGYPYLLQELSYNNNIGKDAVKDLYNVFGDRYLEGFIDFEEGSLDEFKSKYIKVDNRLI